MKSTVKPSALVVDDPTALQCAVDEGRLQSPGKSLLSPEEQAVNLARVMERDASGDSHLCDRRTAWRSPIADDNAVVALQLQAEAPMHRVPDCDLDANRPPETRICRAQLV
jgi:hypothetical protein